jgi:alpha-tubulin suppressor-like RCC1 family protein
MDSDSSSDDEQFFNSGLEVDSLKASQSIRALGTNCSVQSQRATMQRYMTSMATRSGKLYIWGAGGNGRLGNDSQELILEPRPCEDLQDAEIGKFSLGAGHTIALTGDNELLTWGGNQSYQLGHSKVDKWKNSYVPEVLEFNFQDGMQSSSVKAVHAGATHSAALTGTPLSLVRFVVPN